MRSTDSDTLTVPNDQASKEFLSLQHTICFRHTTVTHTIERALRLTVVTEAQHPFGFMLEEHHNGDKDPGSGAGTDIAVEMLATAGCLSQISFSKGVDRTWYTSFSSLERHRASEMMSRIDSIRRTLNGAPRISIPTFALAIACIYRSFMWHQRNMYNWNPVCHRGTSWRTLKYQNRLRRSQSVWLKSCYKKSHNLKGN